MNFRRSSSNFYHLHECLEAKSESKKFPYNLPNKIYCMQMCMMSIKMRREYNYKHIHFSLENKIWVMRNFSLVKQDVTLEKICLATCYIKTRSKVSETYLKNQQHENSLYSIYYSMKRCNNMFWKFPDMVQIGFLA